MNPDRHYRTPENNREQDFDPRVGDALSALRQLMDRHLEQIGTIEPEVTGGRWVTTRRLKGWLLDSRRELANITDGLEPGADAHSPSQQLRDRAIRDSYASERNDRIADMIAHPERYSTPPQTGLASQE